MTSLDSELHFELAVRAILSANFENKGSGKKILVVATLTNKNSSE